MFLQLPFLSHFKPILRFKMTNESNFRFLNCRTPEPPSNSFIFHAVFHQNTLISGYFPIFLFFLSPCLEIVMKIFFSTHMTTGKKLAEWTPNAQKAWLRESQSGAWPWDHHGWFTMDRLAKGIFLFCLLLVS